MQGPWGKINVIMTLAFYPLPPPPFKVTAFQARFSTEKSDVMLDTAVIKF